LRDNGHEPNIIEYLKTPPNVKELYDICKILDKSPNEIIRKGEKEYKAEKINEIDMDDELIKAIAKHPKVIERPIVLRGDRGIIGRPPENVLKLI
jgi:arsenate reductase